MVYIKSYNVWVKIITGVDGICIFSYMCTFFTSKAALG